MDENDIDDFIAGRKVLGLDGVAELLEIEIKQLSERLRSGRIKDERKEEVRIKMIRTLAYLSKTYAQIQQTKTLEDMEKRLEFVEKGLKKGK